MIVRRRGMSVLWRQRVTLLALVLAAAGYGTFMAYLLVEIWPIGLAGGGR